MLSHDEMIGLQAEKHDLIDAENFKSENAFVLHLMHAFAYHKAANLVEGKKVLDLGCNTGYGSNILALTASRVAGADVSENAIATAKAKYANHNTEYRLIDGKQLPFTDKEFDTIITCQVIEHIVDYNIFIGEIKRVLTLSGIVIFTTPNALLRLDPGMKPWNPFHVTEFDQSTLAHMLSQHFKHVHILGLFAEKELYLTEKKRVGKAKAAAQRNRNVIYRNYNRIRLAAARLLRRFARSLAEKNIQSSPASSTKHFADKYRLDDLFYSSRSLKDALDLMAICSNDAQSLNDARRQIESDERQRQHHPADWL
jgi:2-polyprenyl-3-methyl-5-hydroxy-6-metoxy-1,4-benzoquinol methylase